MGDVNQDLEALVGHHFLWFDPPPQYGASGGLIVKVTRIKAGDASPYPIEAEIYGSGQRVQCKPKELRPLTGLERRASGLAVQERGQDG